MGTTTAGLELGPFRLAEHGHRPALVADGETITYAELSEQVRSRVDELGRGRRVVWIGVGNDPESIVSYLATLAGGHVAWLDSPHSAAPPARSPIRPDTIVSVEDGATRVTRLSEEPGHQLHPDLALLLSTSGTTGAPRLVRLSHRNITSNAEAIAEYLGITAEDRALTSLPMHYCYGLSVVGSHLLAGACLLLTERSVSDDAFWALARTGRATSFAGVPHTFELLDRVGFDGMELPDLRYVTQAGGRLAPERVSRYAQLGRARGWSFYVMYGQTEATARMAYLPPELATIEPQSIGVAIPGGTLEIAEVAEVADPEVGELVYRGPNVMMGYAEAPEDLERGRDIAELRTGDLARRNRRGLYEIVGRRSRFVKLFGLRVDLGQVERLLADHDIDAVCAGTDERLVVAVVGDTESGHVSSLISERIGIPGRLVVAQRFAEIPRTSAGKPDYPAILAAAQPAPGARADGVAAVLSAALGRPVTDDDSFSSLGGDSLSYVEVSVGLEELLGELPPEWPQMTVAELSTLRDGARERRRLMRHVETDVALRAGAIALVVASHMTDFWPAGGAHLLLAIAGYSFARFMLTGADLPGRTRRWLTSIGRIAIPSMAWIAFLAVTVGGFSLGSVLLVNNIVGEAALTGARWHYWFVEALVQILIVATVLFSIPAVRRLERRAPFGFALGLAAVLLIPAITTVALTDRPSVFFLTWVVAWVFALGWAVQRARSLLQRSAVTALAAVSLVGFFDDVLRGAVVLAGVLVLLWLPSVSMPRPLVKGVAVIAAASLAIYLTHWQVFPELLPLMPTTVAFALTMAAGVAAWLLVQAAVSLIRKARRRSPAEPDPSRPAMGWSTAAPAGRR